MSPNGRRAWRKWVRRVEHNPKLRPPGKSISRLAREGKRHLGSIPPTPPKSFTSRSLVGMTMGSRKRAAQAAGVARSTYRIGQKLRPCAGCIRCQCRSAFDAWPELGEELAKDCRTCDGSGVLPAKRQLCLGCSWCGTPPKEGATRFTQCDGSGVLPARRS